MDSASLDSNGRDEIMNKLTLLADARNAFAAVCKNLSPVVESKKTLIDHANTINNRMPVLTFPIAQKLIRLHCKHGEDALLLSPISRPDAPLLRGVNDGISYSRGEAPKNHLLTKSSRSQLSSMTSEFTIRR